MPSPMRDGSAATATAAAPAPYSGAITPSMRAQAILSRYRSPPPAAVATTSGSMASTRVTGSTATVNGSGSNNASGSSYLSRSAHVAAALDAAAQSRFESPQRSRPAPYISTSYFLSPTAAAATSLDGTPASPARMRSMLDRPGFSASSVPLGEATSNGATSTASAQSAPTAESSTRSASSSSAAGASATQLKSPARLVAELQALRAQAMALNAGSSSSSEPYRSIFAAPTNRSSGSSATKLTSPSISSASTSASTAAASSVLSPSRTMDPLPLSFSPLKFMLPFRSTVAATPILSASAAAAAARVAGAEAVALYSAEQRFRSPASSAPTATQAPASAPPVSAFASSPAPASISSESFAPSSSSSSPYALRRSTVASAAALSPSSSASPPASSSHPLSLSSPSSLLPYRASATAPLDESEAIVRKYRAKLLLAAATPEQTILAGQVGSSFGNSPLHRSELLQQQLQQQQQQLQQLQQQQLRQLQQQHERPEHTHQQLQAQQSHSQFDAEPAQSQAQAQAPLVTVSTSSSSFSVSIRGRYVSPSPSPSVIVNSHRSPRALSAAAAASPVRQNEGRVGVTQDDVRHLNGTNGHAEHEHELMQDVQDDDQDDSQHYGDETEQYEEENAEEHIHVTVTRFQQPQPSSSPVQRDRLQSPRTPPASQPRARPVRSARTGRHTAPRTSPRRALLERGDDEDDLGTDDEPVRRSLDASFSSAVGDAPEHGEGQQQQQQRQPSLASVFRHQDPSPLRSAPARPSSFSAQPQLRHSPSTSVSFLAGTGLDQQPSAEVLRRNQLVDAARASEIAALASSAEDPPEMSEREFEQLVAPWQREIELELDEDEADADAAAAEDAQREQERERAEFEAAQAAEAEQRRSDAALAAAWSRDTAAEMSAESVGVPADRLIPFLGSGDHAAGVGSNAEGGAGAPDVLTAEQRVQLAALQQSYDASSPFSASSSGSAEASPTLGPRTQAQLNGVVDPSPLPSYLRHADVASLRLAGGADVLGGGADPPGSSELMRLRAAVDAIRVPHAQGLGPWSSLSSQQHSPATATAPRSLLDEAHPLTHLTHRPTAAFAAAPAAAPSTVPTASASFSHSLTRTSRNEDEQHWSRLKQLRPSPQPSPVYAEGERGQHGPIESAAPSASMSPLSSPLEAPFPIHPFADHQHAAENGEFHADGDADADADDGDSLRSHPSLSRLSSANRTEHSVASGSHSPARSARGGGGEAGEPERASPPLEYGLRLSSPSKHSLADPHPQPLFMRARAPELQSASEPTDAPPAAAQQHESAQQHQFEEDRSDASRSRQSSFAHASEFEEMEDIERALAERHAAAVAAPPTAAAVAPASSNFHDPQSVVDAILHNYRSSAASMAEAVAASQAHASVSQDALAQMKQAQQEQLASVQESLASALGLRSRQVEMWHARERQESPRSRGGNGSGSNVSPEMAAFENELESSLSLFHRSPRHAFHPQALRRFADLILALLGESGLQGVLDPQVAQAVHAAVQGIVMAMRQDCGADDEDDDADDDDDAPLSRGERAQLERMDLADFASQCPLSLRLSLLDELVSLLQDESTHALIVAQISASFAGETALLHATHTEHTRRLTEEILAEMQTLQRERADNLAQLNAERRRRLEAITGAARPAHTAESPRVAGRVSPSPALMEQLRSRSSSRDVDAFPVHRLSAEDEHDQGADAADGDGDGTVGDFEPLDLAENEGYDESAESEEERRRQAEEDAAELEELFPADRDGADADAAADHDAAGDADSASGSNAGADAFDAFEEDADGFATVVLRDGTAAVRFDAHAGDDSLDEVSSDDDSVDHGQMDRAQHDADEFPDISAASVDQHDAHAAAGQGRHAAASSRPAPIGQLHGGDEVESSSEEEEEEAEEDEADDNRGNDSTDSIIDRIMRHHNERAQPQSGSGGNAVSTESNTTIVSSSSLSFSRNVLSSSSSAASVSAPSGPDFQALRSLLDVGVESSLARLREKAAQRMAQAVQEQKDLRRHQVELEDLMQIAASREEEEKRAQRDDDDDHDAAVRGDERPDFDGEHASEPAWSGAHEQEEEQHHEEDPRRSSSDEEERDSDRCSDASAEWQREEMQRNDDRDGDDGDVGGDDGDVGGVQFFDLNGTRDHGGENETDEAEAEAEAEAAGQASRANAYAASTAADSGAPSAAASRHGLLMSLRERVDALQAAEARERPATARGRPAPPTLASFTAGAATSSSSNDIGAASTDSELHSTSLFYSSSDALSFLRIDPARARHLHQQFAREQRSFDERHEPTAIPDPDLQTIPPAEGRDDLDPSNFRS